MSDNQATIMDFSDAWRALKAGKHIQRTSWKNFKAYIYLRPVKFGRRLLVMHTMDRMPEKEWMPAIHDLLANDWRIVEDQENAMFEYKRIETRKRMSFPEALKVLAEGKKVRRAGWDDYADFIYAVKMNGMLLDIVGHYRNETTDTHWYSNVLDYYADDWYIVE